MAGHRDDTAACGTRAWNLTSNSAGRWIPGTRCALLRLCARACAHTLRFNLDRISSTITDLLICFFYFRCCFVFFCVCVFFFSSSPSGSLALPVGLASRERPTSRCLDSGIALDASDALLSPSSFGEERLCPLRVFSITLCSAENTQKDTFAFA